MDKCDLHTHPHLVQVWQRRGCRLSVPAAGTDQRRAVFGAVDCASGQIAWRLAARNRGDGFAAVLAQSTATWPDEQLVLVMDYVSYHRSPVVRAWWAAQAGRVTPWWLPVSTPNLDPMERVWRFLKQQLACRLFWDDVDGLQAAATTPLNQTEVRLHTIDPPGIRLVNTFCEDV